MLAARDAYLVQLQEAIDLTLQNGAGEPLGLPTMNGLQNFILIPLGEPLLDGFHLWGLTLPTILATNGNGQNAHAHQTEREP